MAMRGYQTFGEIMKSYQKLFFRKNRLRQKETRIPMLGLIYLLKLFTQNVLINFFTAVAFGLETKNLILAQVGLCLN